VIFFAVESAAGLPPEAAGRAVEEDLAVLGDAALVVAMEVTPCVRRPDPAVDRSASRTGLLLSRIPLQSLSRYMPRQRAGVGASTAGIHFPSRDRRQ
jgi:hypothetical protein